MKVVRAVALRSLRLGLFGVADTVEVRDPPSLPFPVEYKRGRPKKHDADRVQLCAQALCLEEMLGVHVPAGALFYGRTRRREQVVFDAHLRLLTEQTAVRLHELIRSRVTPPAVYEKSKCGRCSLIHLCLPDAPHAHRAASRYLERALATAAAATADSIGPEVGSRENGGAT